MSTAQSRSWRPDKRSFRRGQRRRKLIIASVLIGLIVVLFAWLIIPPAVPPTHLVALVDVSAAPGPAGFPQLSVPGAAFNAARLSEIIDQARLLNEQLLSEPVIVDASSGDGLSAFTTSPGDRLLVYCAVDARTAFRDAQADTLEVLLGQNRGSGRRLTLDSLLNQIRERNCSPAVLLLEPGQLESGLASDVLGDDLIRQVQSAVEAAAVPGLTVIVACDAGQRSWEYVPDRPPATGAGGDTSGTGSATPADPPVSFAGTAFGHFLVEAVMEGRVDSADDLFEYLRDQVEQWVQLQHGVHQTVVRIESVPGAGRADLLMRMTPPPRPSAQASPGDVADATAAAGPGDGAASADGSGQPAQETSPPGMRELFETLLQERDQLAADQVVAVTREVEWFRLQALLLHIDHSLRNGDESGFRKQFDEAQDLLLRLRGLQIRFPAIAGEADVVQWLCLTDPVSAEQAAAFRSLLQQLSVVAESGAAAPLTSDQRTPAFIRAFTSWFVKELSVQVAGLGNLEEAEQRNRVAGWRRALRRALQSGWAAEDLPHQMVTLTELLTGSEDDEWHVAMVPSLMRIIALREQAFRNVTGISPDGSPMRAETWKQVEQQTRQALVRLVAAESWLQQGPAGLEPAQADLDVATGLLTQTGDTLRQAEALLQISDARYQVLPYLIELLAAGQERILLTDKELQAAWAMADAVTAGRDPQLQFPDGLLTADGLQQAHLSAMFALTRRPDASPVSDGDVRHYLRLWDYVNRQLSVNAVGWNRSRLLAIPMFTEFTGRMDVLRSLSATAGGRVERNESGVRNTGLWMSFWSIRMLETLGAPAAAISSLWSDWTELTRRIGVTDKPGADLALLRTRLADNLSREWHRVVQQKAAAAETTEAFTSAGAITRVLTEELQTRRRITGNAAVRGLLGRLSGQQNTSPPAIVLSATDVEVSADGSVQIPAAISGDAGLFVHSAAFDPGEAESVRGDWKGLPRGPNSNGGTGITLQRRIPIDQPTSVRLVAMDADGVVIDAQSVRIHPNSASEWEIQFARPDGERLTTVYNGQPAASHTRFFIDVPANTLDSATRLQKPFPLNVVLRRKSGAAPRVSVQLLASGREPGDAPIPIWPQPVEFPLDPQTGTVALPLQPAPPMPAPDPAVVREASTDVVRGFLFRILPLGVLTQQESVIEFTPRFDLPTQLVDVPEPEWNAEAGELTISIRRAAGIPLIAPAAVPIQVHLSPRLAAFVDGGAATTLPDLKPGAPQRFRFQFDDLLLQELRSGRRGLVGSSDIAQAGPEFSISVAGIPHAWRWVLEANGVRRMDEQGTPEVRAELQIVDEKATPPVARAPELQMSGNWREARFVATAQIHGGQITDADDWQMALFLRRQGNTDRIRLETPAFRGRYFRSAVIAPGEGGAWTMATETQLVHTPEFSLLDYGLSDGRYELIGSLKPPAAGSDAIESATPLLVDGTKPEFRNDGVVFSTSRTPVTDPLRGRILVDDNESGIRSIRVGLVQDPAAMKTVTWTPGAREVDFSIAPVEFPVLEQLETDNPRRVQVYVDVTNGVGLTEQRSFPAIVYRPGKRVETPMKSDPGTLVVTIPSSSTYEVAVSGPKRMTKAGKSEVVFDSLPPGKYTVSWKVSPQGYNPGSAPVEIKSGEETPFQIPVK